MQADYFSHAIENPNSDFVTVPEAQLALYGDEVQIWIFDDPAEQERWQRP